MMQTCQHLHTVAERLDSTVLALDQVLQDRARRSPTVAAPDAPFVLSSGGAEHGSFGGVNPHAPPRRSEAPNRVRLALPMRLMARLVLEASRWPEQRSRRQ